MLKKKRKCLFCKKVLTNSRASYCSDYCKGKAHRRKKLFAVQLPDQERKTSRKVLIKRLDEETSRITIARDKVCVVCGSKDQPTDGHLFNRKHHSLKWDVRPDGNNHLQCWPCNYKHVHDTAPYYSWYINKFGLARFDELYAEWEKPADYSNSDLLDLYNKLKAL